MSAQSSKHTGNKTSPAQQRINRAMSLATLSHLLQLNFRDGARLITLTYAPNSYIPVGAYAERDITNWIRACRKQTGGEFQYVRAAERREGTRNITHRVVVSCQLEKAQGLAAGWIYGLATVEDIAGEQFPALAQRLVCGALTGQGRHSWAASRNLKQQ